MSKPTYANTKANHKCAAHAQLALDAYKDANGTRGYTEDEDVQDLLTDLAHLLAQRSAAKYREFVCVTFRTALSNFYPEAEGMNGGEEVEE